MLKRHEVEVLLKAGHSQAEAARLTGVGLRSVQHLAKEAPVVHVDDAAERKKRRIGRPNVVENFRKQVAAILKQEPDLPSLEILRRVREKVTRVVRPYCMGSWLPYVQRRASRWFVLKACRGNSVNTTLGRWT